MKNDHDGYIIINPPPNEKRLSPRRKFEMEGTISSLTEGVQHPDHKALTRDISVDGVYLWTDAVLAIDEQVNLHIQLPSSEKSQMRGHVALLHNSNHLADFGLCM